MVLDRDLVAIRAGRKVSKSNSLAILALYWAEVMGGRVFLTSSSFAQIKRVLWLEITRMVRQAHLAVDVPISPTTGIRFPGGGEIVGRTANRADNMQGYSGADMLYLADEAGGIPAKVLAAIEGNLAGGGKLVLAGNPTSTSGLYFDAFHALGDMWATIHISSHESPEHHRGGRHTRPGGAVVDRPATAGVGERSALADAHIHGNFPRTAADAVLGLQDVLDAVTRRTDADAMGAQPDGLLYLGVDVGWTGDDPSVIQPRRGLYAYDPTPIQGQDPTQVADATRRVASIMRRPGKVPVVNVDVIGIGAGTYSDLLHNTPSDLPLRVHPINVAERATSDTDDGPGYALLRDQLWFAGADWVRSGGMLPPNQLLRGKLLAAKHTINARGQRKVTPKDALRDVLHRSTDYADALHLSIYHPPTPIIGGSAVVTGGRESVILDASGQPISAAAASPDPSLDGGWYRVSQGLNHPTSMSKVVGMANLSRIVERSAARVAYMTNPLVYGGLQAIMSYVLGDGLSYGEMADSRAEGAVGRILAAERHAHAGGKRSSSSTWSTARYWRCSPPTGRRGRNAACRRTWPSTILRGAGSTTRWTGSRTRSIPS